MLIQAGMVCVYTIVQMWTHWWISFRVSPLFILGPCTQETLEEWQCAQISSIPIKYIATAAHRAFELHLKPWLLAPMGKRQNYLQLSLCVRIHLAFFSHPAPMVSPTSASRLSNFSCAAPSRQVIFSFDTWLPSEYLTKCQREE